MKKKKTKSKYIFDEWKPDWVLMLIGLILWAYPLMIEHDFGKSLLMLMALLLIFFGMAFSEPYLGKQKSKSFIKKRRKVS